MPIPASQKFDAPFLQALRGAAAIMVVLYHSAKALGLPQPQCGFMAVDFFFLLSGVVIEAKYAGLLRAGLSVGRFAWIRLVRIYPLYAAGTAIGFAALLLSGAHSTARLWPTLCLIPRIEFTEGGMFPLNSPAWSLFFELLVNLAYALLVRRLSTAWLAAIILVSWLGMIGNPFGLVDLFAGGFARTGFSFFAGVALYRWYAGAKTPALIGGLGACGVLVVFVAALAVSPPLAGVVPCFDACVTLLFPALMVLALRARIIGCVARIANVLGDLSYPIYAVHVPWLAICGWFFAFDRWHTPLIAQGVAYYVSLVLVCLALLHGFDRPARRRLARLWPAPHRPKANRVAFE